MQTKEAIFTQSFIVIQVLIHVLDQKPFHCPPSHPMTVKNIHFVNQQIPKQFSSKQMW